MPRYKFQCSECENIYIVFLGINETMTDCETCGSENTMIKMYDKFFSKVEKKATEKTGNITKKYIEDNREILKQQKQESRNTDYEPS